MFSISWCVRLASTPGPLWLQRRLDRSLVRLVRSKMFDIPTPVGDTLAGPRVGAIDKQDAVSAHYQAARSCKSPRRETSWGSARMATLATAGPAGTGSIGLLQISSPQAGMCMRKANPLLVEIRTPDWKITELHDMRVLIILARAGAI